MNAQPIGKSRVKDRVLIPLEASQLKFECEDLFFVVVVVIHRLLRIPGFHSMGIWVFVGCEAPPTSWSLPGLIGKWVWQGRIRTTWWLDDLFVTMKQCSPLALIEVHLLTYARTLTTYFVTACDRDFL